MLGLQQEEQRDQVPDLEELPPQGGGRGDGDKEGGNIYSEMGLWLGASEKASWREAMTQRRPEGRGGLNRAGVGRLHTPQFFHRKTGQLSKTREV